MIAQQSAKWDASLAAFNALAPADQATWATSTTSGRAARTLFKLGIYAVTGTPDGTNAATWAASIAS